MDRCSICLGRFDHRLDWGQCEGCKAKWAAGFTIVGRYALARWVDSNGADQGAVKQ